jgi:drug/metabolite transporter (DMT)-like permease
VAAGIEGAVLAAGLASGLLHAAWNAAVKAAPDQEAGMLAQVAGSGAICLCLMPFVPLPAPEALPWLLGSGLFNLLTFLAMLRGYARGGGFGLVYHSMRDSAPTLLLALAWGVRGETTGPVGIAGIAVVSAGVACFAWGEGGSRRAALGYALLSGVMSAGYALCDAQGARLSGSVLGYGLAISVLNALVLGTVHAARHGGGVVPVLWRHRWIATLGASASVSSYVLILWVWSRAPVALGAALRDSSVVFAALIAAWLGERLTAPRIAGTFLVLAGVAMIRCA